HDDACSARFAQRGDLGAHRRAGGDAVVADDHRAPFDRERRAARAQAREAPFHLCARVVHRALYLGRRKPMARFAAFVEPHAAVKGDRAVAALCRPGIEHLAHRRDVERQPELRGHRRGDRHAARRDGEHEGRGAAEVREQGAAFMAYGYARSLHRPAVVTATEGPGVTNLATGIGAAYKGYVPLISVSGAQELWVREKDASQDIDQVTLHRPITKWAYSI